jgi:hypothetical protein
MSSRTVPTSTARPVALPWGATVRASYRDRLRRALHRRAGWMEQLGDPGTTARSPVLPLPQDYLMVAVRRI